MSDTRRSVTSVVALLGVVAAALGLAPSEPSRAQSDTAGEVELERLEGATRFETAAAIATAAFDDADDVVVATGEGFADALAGAALEGAATAPVLLVPSDLVDGSLPDVVTDAVSELGARTATLLGGPAAISPQVEAHLVEHSSVIDTERIAGATRFETAARIAERTTAGQLPAGARQAFELEGATAAFVATGLDWPDSMAASPGAYHGGHPILLTGPDELHAAAKRGLRAAGAEVAIILGGTGVVGPGVAAELRDQGYEVMRLSGADRWATAARVADTLAGEFGYGAGDVGVATGSAFADALAGAPYLGERAAPLVLTPATATAAVQSFFEGRAGDVATLHVFGGPGAVPTAVADDYRQRAGRVESATALAGTVTDADSGEPIAQATVTADGETGFVTTTDAGGGYRLGVDPDTYTVTADADGYQPATITGVTVAEGETVDGVDLTLGSAESPDSPESPDEPDEPDPDLPETYTAAPELVRVTTPFTSDDHAVVSFTFDGDLDALADKAAFHLHTRDGANPTHTTDPDQRRAALDEEDPVVHVAFDREDWDRAVTAGVDAGGVHDHGGAANPEGSLPLPDDGDETPAAGLEGVSVRDGGGLLSETREVVFTFDTDPDGFGASPRFALYGDGGRAAAVFDHSDCGLGGTAGLGVDDAADQVVCEESDSARFGDIDDAVLGGVGSGSVVVELDGGEAANHADSAPIS